MKISYFLLIALVLYGESPSLADSGKPDKPTHWQLSAQLEGSSGTVLSFSADGTKILTAGGKQARIWNASTLQPMTPPLQHDLNVSAATLSADGKVLATASGKTVYLWDVKTGRQVLLIEHADEVHDVAFSADGQRLATACADKTARIWAVGSGKLLHAFTHSNPVLTVCFDPDGAMLLTSASPAKPSDLSVHGTATMWDIESGRELWSEDCDGRPVFTADGKRVGMPSRSAVVRAAKTGECLAEWSFTTGYKGITQLSFSHDGNRLLAAGDDGSDAVDAAARLLQIIPGPGEGTTAMHLKQIRGIAPNCSLSASALSPDGQMLAAIQSCDGFEAVHGLWDAATGKQLLDFSLAEPDQIIAPARERLVAFSPDSNVVAVSYVEGPEQNKTYTKVWKVPQH